MSPPPDVRLWELADVTIPPANLLRRLNPPVRPMTAAASAGRSSIHAAAFGDLMTLVADGEIRTGLPVAVSDSTLEFTASQNERLSEAVDTAQSAGFRYAVVLLDGRSLLLDVASRSIERELSGTESLAVDVDGAVYVPRAEEADAGLPRGPGSSLPPSTVLDQLEAAAATAHHASPASVHNLHRPIA